MNTLIYTSVLILIIGWVGLLIIGLRYAFEDEDENNQSNIITSD